MMLKADFPLAPLLLAVVLGPMIESNFMQSAMMSQNDLTIFFTRPISVVFLILSVLVLLKPVLNLIFKRGICVN